MRIFCPWPFGRGFFTYLAVGGQWADTTPPCSEYLPVGDIWAIALLGNEGYNTIIDLSCPQLLLLERRQDHLMFMTVYTTLLQVILPLMIPVLVGALLARYRQLDTKPLLVL